MATNVAIASTCEAIVRLLRSNHDPALFNGAALDFQVYVAEDFQTPMDAGVSLFLYRIYHNGANRTPAGRVVVDPTGKAAGRGAYLCATPACWEVALKRGRLGQSLHISLADEDRNTLVAHAATLQPDDEQ